MVLMTARPRSHPSTVLFSSTAPLIVSVRIALSASSKSSFPTLKRNCSSQRKRRWSTKRSSRSKKRSLSSLPIHTVALCIERLILIERFHLMLSCQCWLTGFLILRSRLRILNTLHKFNTLPWVLISMPKMDLNMSKCFQINCHHRPWCRTDKICSILTEGECLSTFLRMASTLLLGALCSKRIKISLRNMLFKVKKWISN